MKVTRIAAILLLVLHLAPIRTWAQSSKAPAVRKTPASPYLPLNQYGLKNVIAGIDYPDWFGDQRISVGDREYLVGLFNEREWIRFQDALEAAAEPHITTKSGQTVNLQPLLDTLIALGAAVSPDNSAVAVDAKGRLRIKPREEKELDTPSSAESSGNYDIDLIDKELRWFRQKKYQIPPTISARNCSKQPPFDAICSSLPLWIKIDLHDVKFFGAQIDECKRLGLATCIYDDAFQRSVKGLAQDRAHRAKCETARSNECAK